MVYWQGCKCECVEGFMVFFMDPNILLETPMIKGLESLQVCDLMTEKIACWDEILVEKLFSPVDVIVILSISLSTRQVEDNIIWHHIKTCVYLCKFGYHAAIDINMPNLGDHIDGDWRKLWNLKIPIRIKHLFYQVCQHCIPTSIRLIEKGMEVLNICVVCEEVRESREHVFFNIHFYSYVLACSTLSSGSLVCLLY